MDAAWSVKSSADVSPSFESESSGSAVQEKFLIARHAGEVAVATAEQSSLSLRFD
jgi:hypothetical protein